MGMSMAIALIKLIYTSRISHSESPLTEHGILKSKGVWQVSRVQAIEQINMDAFITSCP